MPQIEIFRTSNRHKQLLKFFFQNIEIWRNYAHLKFWWFCAKFSIFSQNATSRGNFSAKNDYEVHRIAFPENIHSFWQENRKKYYFGFFVL
mgnify:CR=1 FL=1